jgi:tetratricopeptide (TPR) repeat protein
MTGVLTVAPSMSRYFQWIILSYLLGSPVSAIVVLVAIWYGADRLTFQLLPSPLRVFNRWRRMSRLRSMIAINPADRRARLELADLLVGQRRYSAAVEILKPNAEAGDDDATTLYLLGVACLGSGRAEQGEVFLEAARAADANYRLGAIDLELGRWRLARGDLVRAREALERFCDTRRGTVEGKVLLARVFAAQGQAADSRRWHDAAWDEYAAAPGFQRRQERFWAWRARPSRPIAYLGIALACGLAFSLWVVPRLEPSLTGARGHAVPRRHHVDD